MKLNIFLDVIDGPIAGIASEIASHATSCGYNTSIHSLDSIVAVNTATGINLYDCDFNIINDCSDSSDVCKALILSSDPKNFINVSTIHAAYLEDAMSNTSHDINLFNSKMAMINAFAKHGIKTIPSIAFACEHTFETLATAAGLTLPVEVLDHHGRFFSLDSVASVKTYLQTSKHDVTIRTLIPHSSRCTALISNKNGESVITFIGKASDNGVISECKFDSTITNDILSIARTLGVCLGRIDFSPNRDGVTVINVSLTDFSNLPADKVKAAVISAVGLDSISINNVSQFINSLDKDVLLNLIKNKLDIADPVATPTTPEPQPDEVLNVSTDSEVVFTMDQPDEMTAALPNTIITPVGDTMDQPEQFGQPTVDQPLVRQPVLEPVSLAAFEPADTNVASNTIQSQINDLASNQTAPETNKQMFSTDVGNKIPTVDLNNKFTSDKIPTIDLSNPNLANDLMVNPAQYNPVTSVAEPEIDDTPGYAISPDPVELPQAEVTPEPHELSPETINQEVSHLIALLLPQLDHSMRAELHPGEDSTLGVWNLDIKPNLCHFDLGNGRYSMEYDEPASNGVMCNLDIQFGDIVKSIPFLIHEAENQHMRVSHKHFE